MISTNYGCYKKLRLAVEMAIVAATMLVAIIAAVATIVVVAIILVAIQ